jgi:L-glyceraldehyde 3-phosphate reductase
MAALDQAVRQGKALYAGISNYPADRTAEAASILRRLGTPCLIHQPRYSMFDRWIEGGLTEVLQREGIGCIAFSPLAQGLLTDRYLRGIPEGSRAGKPHGFLRREEVTPKRVEKARRLGEIARERGQSLAQMALRWVLRRPVVTSALIGASSVRQLDENLDSLAAPELGSEELSRIDAVLADAEPD